MQRLDLSYFYRMGLAFDGLRGVQPNQPIANVWYDLFQVETYLLNLYADQTIGSALRNSRASANELYSAIKNITDKFSDPEAVYSTFSHGQILGLLAKFGMILQSDLAIADAYIVSEKPPFQTEKLISAGESLFPRGLARKVPAAVSDLKEAGKCIAFELPTAAGFHIIRATESVLRAYWEVVTGNKPKPKQRNIGVYLSGLKTAKCGDDKIIAALQQMKDLHRNALVHPEDILTIEEAISLLGIAHSVSHSMLAVIPEVEPTLAIEAQPDAIAEAADDAATAV